MESISPSTRKQLEELYFDPKTGFSSADKLFQKAKRRGLAVTRKQVKEFVESQESAQILRRPPRIKQFFPITGSQHDYQADLTFYDQFIRQNRGHNVLLTAINIITRRGHAVALKGKKDSEIKRGMEQIIQEADPPIQNLTTDAGSEFISRSFQNLMNQHNINHVLADVGDKKKMGKIERFNKTIRDLIQRYMEANDTVIWHDVLPDLVDNYNDSPHSRLPQQKSPDEMTDSDILKVRQRDIEKILKVKKKAPRFQIGDQARLLRERGTFQKGIERFSREIFTIVDRSGLSYFVADSQGNLEPRGYQFYELQKVSKVEKRTPKPSGQQIQEARREARIRRELGTLGVNPQNIVEGPRTRRQRQTFRIP